MHAPRIHPGSVAPMTRSFRSTVAVAYAFLGFLAVAVASPPVHAAGNAIPAGAVRNPNSKFPIYIDLFGTWRGEGKVGGHASKIEMTWGPAIDGHFIRLTWKNDMTAKEGETLHFEGEGTYRPNTNADGHYIGTWFDSQGKLYPLVGRAAGDSLATTWGSEGDVQGRTTYRLLDRNTIRVTDEARREGTWVQFGQSTLVKQPMAPATTN